MAAIRDRREHSATGGRVLRGVHMFIDHSAEAGSF
jgi:hypothetical protein